MSSGAELNVVEQQGALLRGVPVCEKALAPLGLRRLTERPKNEPLKGSCNLLVEQDLCSLFDLLSKANLLK